MKTLQLNIPDYTKALKDTQICEDWALIPVADKLLIEHWLDFALDNGYRRVELQIEQNSDTYQSLQEWTSQNKLWPIQVDLAPRAERNCGYSSMSRYPSCSEVDTPFMSLMSLIYSRKRWETIRLEEIDTSDRIGPGCEIADDVVLEGNYWIGANVKLSNGVVITGSTVIGKNCFLDTGAIVNSSRVEENSYLGVGINLNNHWAGKGWLLNQTTGMIHFDLDPSILAGMALV